MSPYNIFVNKQLDDIPENIYSGCLLAFLQDVKKSGDLSKLPYAREVVEDKKKGTYRLKGMRNTNPYKRFVQNYELQNLSNL